MGIEMPLTGSLVRCPSVERADELRQRVAPMRPRRVILRQQQAGCVRRELPERDLADVAASLQLDDVFRDGVVEFELAVAVKNRLRPSMRRATATPPAPSGGTIDATCRVTIRSASRSAATDGPAINAVNATATRNRMDASLDTIWSQPRCACASLGASSFAGYVRSLKT